MSVSIKPKVNQIPPKQKIDSGSHALVIGGSMGGLLAARVLSNHFDRVTIVERDRFPEQPMPRQGVPQSSHAHVLLLQGLQILEQLFPDLGAELTAAGAPTIDWFADWSALGPCGWSPRIYSGLMGYTCSRNLLEWLIRRSLFTYDRLQFIEGCQVTGLLTNDSQSQVTGVQLQFRDEATQTTQQQELTADLVVDASGRNSSMPKWLAAMGYQSPEKTIINSFLGYATRWYERPEGFEAHWQGLTVMSKPPKDRRAGLIYPVEGNCWVVTLVGVGRDYPPTDEAGFLDFARSLRSPMIYEAIKDAKPLSPIHSYRGAENRLHHYEKLSRLPEGLVVFADAVCAFNPIYGQGMTTAAKGALILDKCLHQQSKGNKSNLKNNLTGLSQRFQKQLARVNATPWQMATGSDLRWPTTSGGQQDSMLRLRFKYLERALRLGVDHPEVYRTYLEVLHMLKPPTALFQPNILGRVLFQAIGDFFSDRSVREHSIS